MSETYETSEICLHTRRYVQLDQLARECLTLEGMFAKSQLLLICLLIDKEYMSTTAGSCEFISRAFLHTQGYRVSTSYDFQYVFRRAGVLSWWYEDERLYTITLKDLIEHCHGVSYMLNEYIRLFGPSIEEDEDNEIVEQREREQEQEEPEIETIPVPSVEPSPEPDDEE